MSQKNPARDHRDDLIEQSIEFIETVDTWTGQPDDKEEILHTLTRRQDAPASITEAGTIRTSGDLLAVLAASTSRAQGDSG